MKNICSDESCSTSLQLRVACLPKNLHNRQSRNDIERTKKPVNYKRSFSLPSDFFRMSFSNEIRELVLIKLLTLVYTHPWTAQDSKGERYIPMQIVIATSITNHNLVNYHCVKISWNYYDLHFYFSLLVN